MTGDEVRSPETFLRSLGERLRRLRAERGLTLRSLASASGLSMRFLAEIERGQGNVSIARLHALVAALGTTWSELLPDVSPAAPARPIALLGLRGAGKSTVGPLVAAALGVVFVELDDIIEEAAGMGLPEIFALHGEAWYRRLEAAALRRVIARETPVVLAAGGGLVTAPRTFTLLRSRFRTVWLRARPEDHWDRVTAQGDRRPMGDNPAAMAELRSLLAAREPLYGRADIEVDTTALGIRGAVERITAFGRPAAAPPPSPGGRRS